MLQKPKLEGYRAVKNSLNLENYLASKDTTARKEFTNIRSGAGLLRVETGRREKLARDDRTCLRSVCLKRGRGPRTLYVEMPGIPTR